VTRKRSNKQHAVRGPNIWVVHREGRFSIKEEGRGQFLILPVTQETAIGIARLIARAYSSELIVQGIGGRIRLRDSHGSDPFPPRG
jgi:hypothetical protein